MLHFRVNLAIQPRSPSPKHFPASLPSQNQFWLTPFFSQPSLLPHPQLLSFDNHLDCLCPNSKTPPSRSAMSTNPSPINNIANSAPRCQHRFANSSNAVCPPPPTRPSVRITPSSPNPSRPRQTIPNSSSSPAKVSKPRKASITPSPISLNSSPKTASLRVAPPSSHTSAACSSAPTPRSITTANSTSSIQPNRSQSSRPCRSQTRAKSPRDPSRPHSYLQRKESLGLHRGNNGKRFTQKIQHIRNPERLLQKRAAFKSVATFHRRGKFARHENHQRLGHSRCLDHIRGGCAPRTGSTHSAKIQIAQQCVKIFLHCQLRSLVR